MRAQLNASGEIRFEAWKSAIEHAADVDQLLGTMRLYLAAWSGEHLALLPGDLAASALPDRDSICIRAYLASCAELALTGEEPSYVPLREMALTMSAAATRLRALDAYRSVAHIGTRNVGSMIPAGPRGRLEADLKP